MEKENLSILEDDVLQIYDAIQLIQRMVKQEQGNINILEDHVEKANEKVVQTQQQFDTTQHIDGATKTRKMWMVAVFGTLTFSIVRFLFRV